ncbi:MAG: Acyl carrier protein [uncultured Aureispira sp.]|uniref:Acyl carrier protein n=1 Tax=uncultured Aureispira sp. TaxID=1331704 RepID=A0A6S6THS9_9BACT|nr:MAG: Acyl carrier protein [uncultured Aureispira sp.]
MEKVKIIEITNRFLIDEFEVEPDEIILENNFHKTLDLDSLDYVDLVVVIQSNFGFKLTADDFKGVDTFNEFYNMIETHLHKFTKENAS